LQEAGHSIWRVGSKWKLAKSLDFIRNKAKTQFGRRSTLIFADSKKKSAFVSANQRPDFISDKVY